MKIVEVQQLDGTKVEVNRDAITEMVKVREEQPGFLFIFPREAEYDVHLNDSVVLHVDQHEHDKLKGTD